MTALQRVPQPLRSVAAALAFVAAVAVVFHPTLVLWFTGVANGAIYGLLAVGIVLVYRTNRFVNFAAAGLGAVPGALAVQLDRRLHAPYLLAVLVMAVGGLLLGAAVHLVVLRRFARAPRLILTVVSIGITQVLALLALIERAAFSNVKEGLGLGAQLHTPFSGLVVHIGSQPLVNGDEVLAAVVVAGLCGALTLLLTRTRTGIAMRAVAENSDRALLLGIPVERVQVAVWALAGLFGSTAIFLRSSVVGLPLDGSLGYGVLLFSLGAAVFARMESIPRALVGGIAVGVIEEGAALSSGRSSLAQAIVSGVILVVLLLQRVSLSRADDSGVSTWRSAAEFRPVPAALRRFPEVRLAGAVLGLLVLGLAIIAPDLLSPGEIGKLTVVVITAVVAVSLVVLTGWAGQVSLGQYAVVGIAAAVTGHLAADADADFFLALLGGLAAGTIAAVLVALPAVRIPGLYLAVTTLAFAAATEGYLLATDSSVGRLLLPAADGPGIRRPVLLERLDLADDGTFYRLTLVALGVALLIARAFRRYRSGRVVIAVRDNSRAAAACGIDGTRTKIAAFAVSGAIASLAGVLLAYQQGSVDAGSYGIAPSIAVFVAVVIGGSGSLLGGVTGAVLIQVVEQFVEPRWHGAALLVSGPGLVVVLAILPGGLAQAIYAVRDRLLVRVARRHRLSVPALDGRRADQPRGTARPESQVLPPLPPGAAPPVAVTA